MEIRLTIEGQDDLAYWKKNKNIIVLKRIAKLLESIKETPFHGIGKPEALKHNLSGFWSRRIDSEHRVLYEVEAEIIWIHSLKGHY